MRWIPDSSGNFRFRPYYDREELDIECERIVRRFLDQKYGICRYPVSTDDLTVMIEQDTSSLDLYADLSGNGDDVEGLTDFYPNRKPSVRISRRLSLDGRNEHRLRTTLAHEYGHVKFHTFLWETDPPDIHSRRQSRSSISTGFRTGKQGIPYLQSMDKDDFDWMEWQADYACGAFLMPLTPLKKLTDQFIRQQGNRGWLADNSPECEAMVAMTAQTFDVSNEAARLRLRNIGLVQPVPVGIAGR